MTAAICISGLPSHCKESDIQRALLLYGTAVRVQLDGVQRKALVTMRTPQETQAVLSRPSINVLGDSVRVESADTAAQHQTTTHDSNAVYSARMMYAPQSAPYQTLPVQPRQLQSQPAPQQTPCQPPPPSSPLHQQQRQHHVQPSAPSTYGTSTESNSTTGHRDAKQSIFPTQPSIYGEDGLRSPKLQATITNCQFPITHAVLTQMFNMIDKPVSVHCGPAGQTTTGSVEFATIASAERAVREFDDKNIYPNCCLLRLSYVPVEVDIPTRVSPPPNRSSSGDRDIGAVGRGRGVNFSDEGSEWSKRGCRGAGRGKSRLVPDHSDTHEDSFDPFRAPRQSRVPALITDGKFFDSSKENSVLIENTPSSASLHELWTLLEVFGNVFWLRRTSTERTNVAAKFQNKVDGEFAVRLLDGVRFRGRVLSLQMVHTFPSEDKFDEWDSSNPKDPRTSAAFFGLEFHRTNPSFPFNDRGRVPPNRFLHVDHIPTSVSNNMLKGLTKVQQLQIERWGQSKATMKFKDVEAAIEALIEIHGKQINGQRLSVVFSRRYLDLSGGDLETHDDDNVSVDNNDDVTTDHERTQNHSVPYSNNGMARKGRNNETQK